MAIFSGACYINRRLARQGAFILADTTSDAQFIYDIRLLHDDCQPGITHHFNVLETNGFVRGRTVFLADHTIHLFGIWQAVILIENGQSDDRLFFDPQWQLGYGAGGTYLAAEAAVVFAVADPADQYRAPDPLEARLH